MLFDEVVVAIEEGGDCLFHVGGIQHPHASLNLYTC